MSRPLCCAAVGLAACSGDEGPTGPEPAAGPCLLAPSCSSRLEVAPDRWVRVLRTHDLDAGAPAITHAVVLVHGSGRNAGFNFNTGVRLTAEPSLRAAVAIVAPLFVTTAEDPLPDEPFWSSGGWKRGNLSVRGGPVPRVSSYEVLDTIVARLSDPLRFPDMREIVVAGHSAGGQVAHRYAAGGMNPLGVHVRYVVANPSSYLFLGPERPDGAGGFDIPTLASCPDYQQWHYGLQDLNTYMRRIAPSALPTRLTTRLTTREVTIMVGDQDTGESQLDVRCGANLQGEHRLARGLNLLAYMDAFHAGHAHVGIVIPGVGHSSRGMFLSPRGRAALLP